MRHVGTSAVTTRERCSRMQCLSGSARRHRRPVPAAASAAAAAPAPATTTTTTSISPDVKSLARPQQAAAGLAGSTSCTLWTARRWLSTHPCAAAACAVRMCDCGARARSIAMAATARLGARGPGDGLRAHMERHAFASPAEQWTRRGGGAGQRKQAARHGPRNRYFVGLHRPAAAPRGPARGGDRDLAPSPVGAVPAPILEMRSTGTGADATAAVPVAWEASQGRLENTRLRWQSGYCACRWTVPSTEVSLVCNALTPSIGDGDPSHRLEQRPHRNGDSHCRPRPTP